MNLKEIETKLDKLTKEGKLYSKEGNLLIESWIEQKCEIEFGVDETLNYTDELVFHKDKELIFLGEHPNKPVDVLFIFLHSGLKLPLDYPDFFNKDLNWKDLAGSIYDNHDIGTRNIFSRLAKDLEEKNTDFTYSIVFYNYTRIAADVNRLRLVDQVIDEPYRGFAPWNKNVDKKLLSKEIVNPFFKRLKRYISRSNPKLIFYPHTYDTYGGGRASSGHEIAKEEAQLKRPASMLFNYYNLYRGEPFGYYSKARSARFNFLKEDEVKLVQRLQYKNINMIQGLNEDIEVTVDYPYMSPPQLPGLIWTYYKGPQVILENRKDLFAKGDETIYKSVLEIAEGIIQL